MTGFKVRDYDPNKLPAPIVAALGYMAQCSAQTENIVQGGIWRLLGVDDILGSAVTLHANAPMLDQMLRSVAELVIDDLDHLDKLDDLLDEVKTATIARNKFIHYSICRDEETNECFLDVRTARGSLEYTLDPITAQQIHEAGLRIYNAGISLLIFFNGLGLKPLEPRRIYANSHKKRPERKKRRKTAEKVTAKPPQAGPH